MNIVVVGATGFVGRNLVPYLGARGHDVTAVSRSGEHVRGAGRSIRQGDICNVATLADRMDHSAEVIVYLSAIAHRGKSEPEDLYDTINRRGAMAWAGWAVDHGVRRFIYLSSSKVHGVVADGPIDESSPLVATDAYSRSKIEAETELATVKSNTEVIILRPPIVLGPGAKGNIALLHRAAGSRLPLPVSRPPALRSVVSIENLMSAIECAAAEGQAGAYLVADEEPLSTEDLYGLFCRAAKRPARVLPVPTVLLRVVDAAVAPLLGRKPIEALYSTFVIDASHFAATHSWSAQATTASSINAAPVEERTP